MPNGYDSLFFEEIDGLKRWVVLRGTEAPHGGARIKSAFDLGGKLRSTRHFEPGAEAPVRHVTGTEENDLVVQVHFRDSLTGEEGLALERLAIIDGIRRAGRPLNIYWGKIIRRGVLKEFTPSPESSGEIPAKLVFEIDDQGKNTRAGFRENPKPFNAHVDQVTDAINDLLRGSKVNPTPFNPNNDLVLDALSDVSHLLDRVGKPGITIPGLVLPDISGALQSGFSALTNPLAQILAIGEDLQSGIEDTKTGLSGAANAAKALLTRAKNLAGFIASLGDPTNGVDAADAVAWKANQTAMLIALQRVVNAAYKLGIAAERRGQGVTAGSTYIVSAGDTVESIARSKHTTPAAVRALNPQLPLSGLAAGTEIKLP